MRLDIDLVFKRCYLLQMPPRSHSQSNTASVLRTYWCSRARRFIAPGDPFYDPAEYERMTQGPLERGAWGDDVDTDSGCFLIP